MRDDYWKDRFVTGPDAPFDMGLSVPATYLWRVVNGNIVGAFAWTAYTGDNIQMHYAGHGPYWMSRRFLREAFTYPFEQLRVKVILAFLPEDRLHACDVAIRLGFRRFGDGLIPGVRLHMLTMVREDCRWLALSSQRSNG